MKLLSIVLLLFVFFTTTNTQDLFDYERFLTVFSLKFDYERFIQTFFLNSQIDPTRTQTNFDYDKFVKTFFNPELTDSNPKTSDTESTDKTNLSVEPESPDTIEVQSSQQFDIETFKKVFNLECNGQCPKDFNYEKFIETFNLRSTEEKFDYQRFLDVFNIQVPGNDFDWERFINIFFPAQDQTNFDKERFLNTSFETENQNKNGGAVLIVDRLPDSV